MTARSFRASVCQGILTHSSPNHFDLADSFHRRRPDSTLFLRAPRQPDGRRDFKLTAAAPLPTSYGVDIYYRIGGWLGERDGDSASASA